MEEEYYHLELPIEAVRIIHIGLTQAVEKWSGGNLLRFASHGAVSKTNLWHYSLSRASDVIVTKVS